MANAISPEDLQKIIDAAVAKQLKRLKKKVKPTSAPASRITLGVVDKIYEETGFQAMRAHLWFQEPKRLNPLVRVNRISDDYKAATPIGAFCIFKLRELESSDPNSPVLDVFDCPSWQWVAGSIADLLGMSCSYILGFESASKGNAPGHPMCSTHFHCGYEDGKLILDTFVSRGWLPSTG